MGVGGMTGWLTWDTTSISESISTNISPTGKGFTSTALNRFGVSPKGGYLNSMA